MTEIVICLCEFYFIKKTNDPISLQRTPILGRAQIFKYI